MTATRPRAPITAWLWFGLCVAAAAPSAGTAATPRPDSYWQVDDLRPGMKGHGRTVLQGTRIETFDAEILGILKNTSPGRDMVLCRLSGLNLERTGVIAGMSGSPIYISGRLVGAVAFAWPFGKEPIAGVTPFSQMCGCAEPIERRDIVAAPHENGTLTHQKTNDVEASQSAERAPQTLRMVALQTPVAASGMTPHSLNLLADAAKANGWLPVQAGAVPARVLDEEAAATLQPGSPMAIALITGDFDLSGMGTVTHIEGDRVYGFGHPFLSLGACELPLMTGYVHTVYPRQTVSFKMGSPLRAVGVVNADVSTCVAGHLGRKADMLPVTMTLTREGEPSPKTYHVEVVRQRSLVGPLVYAALTNSVDAEGDLPEDLTADLDIRLEIEGRPPVVIQDTFSGPSYSGGRAPHALFSPVASVINMLSYNPYRAIRINRIDCVTHLRDGRRTAEIESVELASEEYAPGETVRATAFVRPHKGAVERVPLRLKLPPDLPEGTYSATVCDEPASARMDVRDNPCLFSPQNVEQVFAALAVQTHARRSRLVLRVPLSSVGVAVEGECLPDLPPSMVQILGASRRTGALPVQGALVARRTTPWVVQGSETVRFTVTKNKKATAAP